jgi:HD-GYP domain-containing protein (c-di-GMP phosphodiesterase class II)
MTSDRPYRRALPLKAALEEIERESGTLYDPRVASAFLGVSAETWRRIGKETGTVQASSVMDAGTNKPSSEMENFENNASE